MHRQSLSIFCLSVLLAGAVVPSHAQGVISGPPMTGSNSGGGGGAAAPPPPSSNQGWIAVAGGFGGNGSVVNTGYSGVKNSRGEAEDAALAACRRRGGGANCRNPFAVSSGCLYIVPGRRRGGVTWGRGGSVEAALNECRRGGYSCDRSRVIGGCVN